MGFADGVKSWVKKITGQRDTKLAEVVLVAYKSCLLRSPILTERFRDSWRIAINSPDESMEDPRNPKTEKSANAGAGGTIPATADEIAYAKQILSRVKFGDTVYITNNVPYALRLENGYSGQAPTGVLALSLLEAHATATDVQIRDADAVDLGAALER